MLTTLSSAILLLGAPVGQAAKAVQHVAEVYFDANKPPVVVRNILLDFRFTGFGMYSRSDYPKTASVPLENGIRVDFKKIEEFTLSQRQVEEVGDDGKKKKRLATDATIILPDREPITESVIPRGAIWVVGETDLGPFELGLMAKRPIRVVFRR